MATLAEQRCTTDQHTRVIRTVRCMTQTTIFTDGGVLPKIGSAFFCVAFVAGVVQRLPQQLRRCGFAVRAMASATVHFLLEQRMGKCF